MRANPNLVYCAARLFALQDRFAIEIIADEVSSRLKAHNLEQYKVFLPFRDTSQDGVVTENKSNWIYEKDICYLENSKAVVALVDGVSKDDGVAMELGFAFGKGTPYILSTSDFVWQEPRNTSIRFICDPLVDHFSSSKVAVNSSEQLDRTLSYRIAHLNLLKLLSVEVANNVVRILSAPPKPTQASPTINAKVPHVYVDIAGGRYAWSSLFESEICKTCRFERIIFGRRWLDGCSGAAIEIDFDNLRQCSLCVIIGESAEVDAGSAFLHGAAVALGIPVALFYSRQSITRGPGGQTMWRNLMLAESSTWQPTSIAELAQLAYASSRWTEP
jgi:nucleoside 2-deoxyribosyltransferase